PRYDQMRFDHDKLKNQLCPIVSNNPSIEALRINQDASLYLGEFDESNIVKHQMASTKHGVYVFVIEGMVTISGQELQRRDGMGIQDEESVLMHIASNSKILLIEVPV
ncbi:MAG: pirin family protein, partial [Ignavibacteria bacterium]